MDITKATAARVSAAIESAGETVLGISQLTRIPRTTLIRRLDGLTPFTIAELAAIATALDISPVDLIGGHIERESA